MKESDKKIIDDVDDWKKREFEIREREILRKGDLEQEKIRLNHQRWMKVGAFIKWALVSVAGLTLVLGSGYGIHIGCSMAAEEEAAFAVEEVEEARKKEERQRQYDLDWVSCVESIGIEKCEIVREVSYERGYDDGYERRRRNVR